MPDKKYIQTPEIWLTINNYQGYDISNLGRVRSYRKQGCNKFTDKPKIIKQIILKTHCKEYKRVSLRCSGKTKNEYVHRLVAKAFHKNLENKPQVNHIDNNPFNNKENNLEWCNNSENQRHINKGKISICKDRNSFRVFFITNEGLRKSKNFKERKLAELFANTL